MVANITRSESVLRRQGLIEQLHPRAWTGHSRVLITLGKRPAPVFTAHEITEGRGLRISEFVSAIQKINYHFVLLVNYTYTHEWCTYLGYCCHREHCEGRECPFLRSVYGKRLRVFPVWLSGPSEEPLTAPVSRT